MLFIIALIYSFEFQPDLVYSNFIGAGIITLIAIRRILIFFQVFSKTINPYKIFVVFIIGITLPLIGKYLSKPELNADSHSTILIGYIVAIYLLIYIFKKTGAFGKEVQEKLRKSEEALKQKNKESNAISDNKKTEQNEVRKQKELKQKENSKLKQEKNKADKAKDYVLCKNCGDKYTSPRDLLRNNCYSKKYHGQKHVLYEGAIKDKYICKHCGRDFPQIKGMIITKSCTSPDKFHEPML
jgi:DNA-directed RNA polymerase subunit RPC12/RpoP